ncbi:MAG: HEAT repeat domain-containing protein [Candidatus Sumerlaeia bacterium]|nr:HEAT repeat domain-containing protein [Candidatus Sumerlaeia bacterium]
MMADLKRPILIFVVVVLLVAVSYYIFQRVRPVQPTPQIIPQLVPEPTPASPRELTEKPAPQNLKPAEKELPAGTPSSITPTSHRVKSTPEAQQLADRLKLPLVGKLKDAEDISGENIHVTPEAVYAGTNQEVIDLLNKLADEEAEARAEAVSELAEYVEEENLEPVIVRIMEIDKDGEVRSAAAAALEDAKLPETIDALIMALYDPAEEVREHARTTLGLIGSEEVRQKLKSERERTNNPEVREIIDQILEQVLDEPLRIEGEEE